MAVPVPRTWSVGDAITAARLNDVRDALNFLLQPPRCRVYNSANISIPDATNTGLTFDTERFDNDTMHSTVSSTGRITFTTAGIYEVGANVLFDSNATGVRELFIALGASVTIANMKVDASATEGVSLSVVTEYSFSAGQYIEAVVRQNSGGALNVVSTGNWTPEFWARWVST